MDHKISKDENTESIAIYSYDYYGEGAGSKFNAAETLIDTIIEHLTLIGASPIVSKDSKGF